MTNDPRFLIRYVIVWLTGLGTFELAKEYEGREVFLFVGFFITFVTTLVNCNAMGRDWLARVSGS